MLLYKPLPDNHENAPGFWQHVVPDGADNMARYAEKGWLLSPPSDASVYNDAGELVSGKKKPAAAPAKKVGE